MSTNQYSPNYDDGVIYNQMNDNVYGPNTGLYRDMDLTFGVNPNTGDVKTLSDTDCIKQSVLSIICLNKFDIPFNIRDFSNLKRLLFENDSHAVYASISTNLENLISVLEPRVRVNDINIEFNELDSSFTVDIKYTIIRTNTDDIVTKVIERVR